MDADDRFDSSDNRETAVRPRSIVRRVASHWPRILLLWLVLATPVNYLIYTLDEPTYEAFSLLQVQPSKDGIFQLSAVDNMDRVIAMPYLETQVSLLTSDMVLDAALSRPASTTSPMIAKLPMIAKSKDPKADIRKEMVVEIVKNTFLIRVALASRDPEEAALIVNAVVDSYLEQHSDYHRTANKTLRKSLEGELNTLKDKIEEKNRELRQLNDKSLIVIARPRVNLKSVKAEAAEIHPALTTFTEEQYTKLTDRLIQADLELIEARARLETAKLASGGPDPARPADATRPQPIAERSSMASADKLRELEAGVEEAKRKRIAYAQYITNVEVQHKTQDRDHFNAKMLDEELASLLRMQEIIEQKLEQLRFEQKQDVYLVTRHDLA